MRKIEENRKMGEKSIESGRGEGKCARIIKENKFVRIRKE